MMRIEIIVMERYMKIIHIGEKIYSYEKEQFGLVKKLTKVSLIICC